MSKSTVSTGPILAKSELLDVLQAVSLELEPVVKRVALAIAESNRVYTMSSLEMQIPLVASSVMFNLLGAQDRVADLVKRVPE